jgi:hypothetical protein
MDPPKNLLTVARIQQWGDWKVSKFTLSRSVSDAVSSNILRSEFLKIPGSFYGERGNQYYQFKISVKYDKYAAKTVTFRFWNPGDRAPKEFEQLEQFIKNWLHL